MQFAIGLVTFWLSYGIDITTWRKSVDGTQAIVGVTRVINTIPDILVNPNVTIYNYPSQELTDLMNSPAWTISEVSNNG